MKVWMMNPNRLPSELGACAIISDDPDGLLPGYSLVVKTPDRTIGYNTTIEEEVRRHREAGFVRVVPAEEIEAYYILHITAPDGRFLYNLAGYAVRGDGYGCTPVDVEYARNDAEEIREIAKARGVNCRVFLVLCE